MKPFDDVYMVFWRFNRFNDNSFTLRVWMYELLMLIFLILMRPGMGVLSPGETGGHALLTFCQRLQFVVLFSHFLTMLGQCSPTHTFHAARTPMRPGCYSHARFISHDLWYLINSISKREREGQEKTPTLLLL